MAAVKDVLRNVRTEVAGRRRKCYRHPKKHIISKGEVCLVVKDGPQKQSTYCLVCARDILDVALQRVEALSAVISEVDE